MYQLYLAAVLFTAVGLRMGRWVIASLLFGMATCGSTALIISLMGSLAWFTIVALGRRGLAWHYAAVLLAASLSFIFYLALWKIPSVGLDDKINASQSVQSRMAATKLGIDLVGRDLWGVGIGNVHSDLSAVNIFALAGQIGLIGAVLFVAVLTVPIIVLHQDGGGSPAVGAIFISVLVTSVTSNLSTMLLLFVLLLSPWLTPKRTLRRWLLSTPGPRRATLQIVDHTAFA
jgi:hypothetical protein